MDIVVKKLFQSKLPANADFKTVDKAILKKELDRIYWILDFAIIPPCWILYFLTSGIRSNVGLALTMNKAEGHTFQDKLKLSTHELSLALALFYVGYLVFDMPFNLVMTKVSPHAWMSRITISIGLVGTCLAACNKPWSFILVRALLGVAEAGLWPGLAYYMTLWYPPHRIARRIGYYFTAAQISAAAVGLVSAGFQYMDGIRGYTGYQWMFIVWGVVGIAVGIALLFWLPERPSLHLFNNDTLLSSNFNVIDQDEISVKSFKNKNAPTWKRVWWLISRRHILTGIDERLHCYDMAKYSGLGSHWTWRQLLDVLLDPFLWPLMIMYFGVVGTGFGVQTFASTLLSVINPAWSSVSLSLLTAPIWICDLIGILLITPISDKYYRYRFAFFNLGCVTIITGFFVTTFHSHPWSKYAGLLVIGFGLGPTVPICMTWTAEIFATRYGEVGSAFSTAFVSGVGNLGSVMTTYALYTGWPEDAKNQYRNSNMVLVAINGISIIASFVTFFMIIILKRSKEIYSLKDHNDEQISTNDFNNNEVDAPTELEHWSEDNRTETDLDTKYNHLDTYPQDFKSKSGPTKVREIEVEHNASA